MFDHIGLVFADLGTARRFYASILSPLGISLLEDHTQTDGTGWLVFATGAAQAPFFVVASGRPSFWQSDHVAGATPAHLCFRAPSKAAVDAFYQAGLEAGGRDNGEPGIRREPFYCAFLIDPGGNNVEAGLYL